MPEDTKRLPRLQRQQQYFNPDGTPTAQMQSHWQAVMKRIEELGLIVDP